MRVAGRRRMASNARDDVKQTRRSPRWHEGFEARLDGMLEVLGMDRSLPKPPDSVLRRPEFAPWWRCDTKRGRLAKYVGAYPAEVGIHKDALMDVVVHDLDPSRNQVLIRPVIAAIGYRAVHERLIDRLEGGSYVEQVGAVKAWYWAQPTTPHTVTHAFDYEDQDPDTAAQYAGWLELVPRWREACRRALEACVDPHRRAYLNDFIANSTKL